MDQNPLGLPGNSELALRLRSIRRIVETRDLPQLVDLLPTLCPRFETIRYFGIGVYETSEGQTW